MSWKYRLGRLDVAPFPVCQYCALPGPYRSSAIWTGKTLTEKKPEPMVVHFCANHAARFAADHAMAFPPGMWKDSP